MRIYRKVILPSGFRANGIASGIKRSGRLDLALFYSDIPAKAVCQFTANKIQAAPVQLAKSYLEKNKAFRAIIVNSGNANCFTGKPGFNDARKTAQAVSRELKIKEEAVLVSSTGIIARRLPLLKIVKAVPALARGLSPNGIDKAKLAIMTTDTFSKEITVRLKMGTRTVTLCGIAKGAGMIAPDMATMLAYIFTDANIAQTAQGQALKEAVRESFNCISVDGCMSTNDSVMMLANGCAGNRLISSGKELKAFTGALKKVCLSLALDIVRDAEGATKFITITVTGARTESQAKRAALAIANSALFKTAMYGENPNLGRIVSAVGASGIDVREKDLKIKLGPLNKKDITVAVSLSQGKRRATVYTSDLTPQYIKINAEYS